MSRKAISTLFDHNKFSYSWSRCDTRVIRKGSRMSVLEPEIFESDRLAAKAVGTYSTQSR